MLEVSGRLNDNFFSRVGVLYNLKVLKDLILSHYVYKNDLL